MSDSKNPSTTMQQDSDQAFTFSRNTTLRDSIDASSSIHTLKPTLSPITEEGALKENSWKKSVRAAYLKFEAKTPHGKDRLRTQAWREHRAKMGKEMEEHEAVMYWQSAPWAMGQFCMK